MTMIQFQIVDGIWFRRINDPRGGLTVGVGFNLCRAVVSAMADPPRAEIASELHAVSFGDSIACDYHSRPMEIDLEEPLLVEAIRLIDHPQLQCDEWPDGWVLDAARCADHTVDAHV